MSEAEFHKAFLSIGVNDKRPVRLGFEFSRIFIAGRMYLDRFIAYVLGGTVRLHKFHRGDDDRAPHDHPWWFITFPFVSYRETYWIQLKELSLYEQAYLHVFEGIKLEDYLLPRERTVKAWRFHFRPAKFRHIVLGRADGKDKPFWSFCISGAVKNAWGFWPTSGPFVPHREWNEWCEANGLTHWKGTIR